jgi:hypothetical protein
MPWVELRCRAVHVATPPSGAFARRIRAPHPPAAAHTAAPLGETRKNGGASKRVNHWNPTAADCRSTRSSPPVRAAAQQRSRGARVARRASESSSCRECPSSPGVSVNASGRAPRPAYCLSRTAPRGSPRFPRRHAGRTGRARLRSKRAESTVSRAARQHTRSDFARREESRKTTSCTNHSRHFAARRRYVKQLFRATLSCGARDFSALLPWGN